MQKWDLKALCMQNEDKMKARKNTPHLATPSWHQDSTYVKVVSIEEKNLEDSQPEDSPQVGVKRHEVGVF
jgi:hypothetical protein